MKIFRILFLLVNILFAVLLIISYLGGKFSPHTTLIPVFLVLSYPFLLFANIVFLFVWIFTFPKYVFVSLISILLGFNQLSRHFQIAGVSVPEDSIQNIHIMSYNVQLFGFYNWNENTRIRDSIIEFVKNESPDILCFQEYYKNTAGQFETNNLLKNALGKPFEIVEAFSTRPDKNQNFGIASYIRYPVINHGEIHFEHSFNMAQFVDFIYQGDTVRLYNVHLQSNQFEKDDYANMGEIDLKGFDKDDIGKIRGIMRKIAYATKKRADQVDILKQHIDSSVYPVIICGDFNDTPGSYAYYQLIDNKKDAFRKSGKAYEYSYKHSFLKMRIDYIMYDKEFQSFDFTSHKIQHSDHFPVSCYLRKK
jgi:endonuclease/exonuclease/phosphatase family metal-dependent hydrolase